MTWAMRASLLLLGGLAALSGCSPMAEATAERLYVFDCGQILVTDMGQQMSPGIDVGVSRSLFVPCYLIEHAKGRLIFDAGLPDTLAELGDAGEWSGDGGFQSTVKRTLAAQLREIDVDPASIDFVAFSHLHFDHTGNGNLFSGADWLVQGVEFDAGFGADAREHFFAPDTYATLKDRAVKLAGDHDVFGDGSVMLLSTPGHTIGHQVLAVRLPRRGSVVLSGDLWHTAKNRAGRVTPSFNFDREQTLASMDRIERYLADTGATLWIEHDPAQHPDVPRAPAFVE
jgi:glyoxylase-like metal-dependent hydrolase (beta-lactamase superfamily II)